MYVRIYTSSGRWVTDVMTYIYVVWSLKYYVILYPRLLIKFCIYSLGTQRVNKFSKHKVLVQNHNFSKF